MKPSDLLTVEQLAQWLHCSPATIRCNCTRAPHRLPPVLRIGGRLLFRRAAIEAWLTGHEEKPTVPVPTRLKRGRPSKAEQIARARLAAKDGTR